MLFRRRRRLEVWMAFLMCRCENTMSDYRARVCAQVGCIGGRNTECIVAHTILVRYFWDTGRRSTNFCPVYV